jgi:hypothetical protein
VTVVGTSTNTSNMVEKQFKPSTMSVPIVNKTVETHQMTQSTAIIINSLENPAIISSNNAATAPIITTTNSTTPQLISTPSKTNEFNSKHNISTTLTPKIKKAASHHPHNNHNNSSGSNNFSNKDTHNTTTPTISGKKSSDLLSSIMASMDSTQY